MIICSCNVLRERDLEAACLEGFETAEQVLGHLGCRIQCGKCTDYVESVLLCPRRFSQAS
ncbi:MAG: bacterioferritin-associated ferredoxin [Alphaproteobacteria bacterium]|jgi:bacterioferritin-associated ferredoxin